MNGSDHHGHHFLAGEIGLMCMGPQYVEQDFGSRGCLETLSGLGRWLPLAKWNPEGADSPDWLRSSFAPPSNGDDRRARRSMMPRRCSRLRPRTCAACSIRRWSCSVVRSSCRRRRSSSAVARSSAACSHAAARVVSVSRAKEAPLSGSLLVARQRRPRTARGTSVQQLGRMDRRHGAYRCSSFDNLIRLHVLPRSTSSHRATSPLTESAPPAPLSQAEVQPLVLLRDVAAPALHEPCAARCPRRER